MIRIWLEIRTGMYAGHRVAVAPGRPVRVGRHPPAEVVIPDDPLVSELHFAVECGPGGCRVRDLGSRFGTFVRGERVAEADFRPGDDLRAGHTHFALIGPAGVVAAAPVVPPTPAPATVVPAAAPAAHAAGTAVPPAADAIRDWLAGQDPLFAVLDAAREPSIPARLARSGERYQSLFEGPRGIPFAPYGPWLVGFTPGSKLLAELVSEGWGQNWGVYLTCDGEFAEVRKHLRRFLTAKLPDGRNVLFRFYDPRVLRTFLPACSHDELLDFCGPVLGYFAEGADGTTLQEFWPAQPRWHKARVTTVAR